jgi:type II secretory pathway component GspD/PulD (secretin)
VRDYEENLKAIGELVTQLDTRPQQVLIAATILRATLDENNALGIDFNLLSGVRFSQLSTSTNALTSFTNTDVNTAALPHTDSAAFRTDFSKAVPAGGLTIGFLSDDISVLLRAMESITDVNVLANPKLLVINKQRGEVMIGDKKGYLTTTVTDTVATQTVEFLETGTHLIVRPFIGRDGYIRMEIHPEDSDGAVELIGESALPSETTTEATSNVLIKDGHTFVIGGLFRERTNVGRSQIPLAGNLPYLGSLFRSTVDVTSREEVIILITPHILEDAAAATLGQQSADDVERFRVGLRKGLRWWGRSGLAQTHMRWAREAADKGQNDNALWNVDMALSLEPKMMQAIEMKEQLTGKAYWSDEFRCSSVRYLVPRILMQEMGKSADPLMPPDQPVDVEQIDPAVRERLGIQPRPQAPTEASPAAPLESSLKE